MGERGVVGEVWLDVGCWKLREGMMDSGEFFMIIFRILNFKCGIENLCGRFVFLL